MGRDSLLYVYPCWCGVHKSDLVQEVPIPVPTCEWLVYAVLVVWIAVAVSASVMVTKVAGSQNLLQMLLALTVRLGQTGE